MRLKWVAFFNIFLFYLFVWLNSASSASKLIYQDRTRSITLFIIVDGIKIGMSGCPPNEYSNTTTRTSNDNRIWSQLISEAIELCIELLFFYNCLYENLNKFKLNDLLVNCLIFKNSINFKFGNKKICIIKLNFNKYKG